jgi:hypothetical protein
MKAALVAALVVALTATACSSTPAPPGATTPPLSSTPASDEASASPTADALPRVETLADLAGTRWGGRDSEGDSVTFDFEEGGQLTYFSFGERYSREGDTWSVDGDTLTWLVTFGGPYGTCTYVGALDAVAQMISAPYTCSASDAPSGTIELEQRPA